MEHGSLYPPVSHKIQGQPYLFLRYFRDSHACHPTIQNILGSGACMNWRSQGPSPLAFPGRESSSIPPFKITIGAPVERSQRHLLINLVLELITTTAVAPIERMKLLIQSQNMMINSGQLSQPYKGILNCFTRTIRNEGFFALWRGNTANLICLCSMEALSLALTSSYVSYFSYMKDKSNTTSAFLLSVRFLIVGAAARILLIYPLLYAETRLANDIKTARNFGGRNLMV
ncbi:hypothetical protein SLEP1_g13572 [Rubroshorea leprosula]|uniref:ADP/ATP translocase n=1 Tax=Rubroshorea leprosula TaxID=152421 RepID=A0AAV5IM43_9ROSI|nr:hypothetical protein SLEP1_g13572 [Rubroshorea leprosula]